MKSASETKYQRIFSVILILSLIVSSAALVIQCIRIYMGAFVPNGDPFTPEAVAAAFSEIKWVIYPTLLLILVSFPVAWIIPMDDKKVGDIPPVMILSRLCRRADLSSCKSTLLSAIQIERKLRKKLFLGYAGVFAFCALIFLGLVLSPSFFDSADINGSMLSAMYLLVPCLIAAFVSAWLLRKKALHSILTEISLLKTAPRKSSVAASDRRDWSRLMSIVVLAFAICMVIFGFINGGSLDVLTKAINICTECVGLG